MSFCVLYSVVLEYHSVQNSPWGSGGGGLLAAHGLYQGILPTEHFPKFDCVVNSRKEFVCDADAESFSLSDIWLR